MSSPFSKKNLPFIVFAVIAVLLVVVLVFKPFQSSFGAATLSQSQIQGRYNDSNMFGSLTVEQATEELDKVINKARTFESKYATVDQNLYSQVQQTLPGTISYRNNISASTSVFEIIKMANVLSYPMELLEAKYNAKIAP
jgi:hypothetical protein